MLQAASTLHEMGRSEADVLARKRTQLSLAKLSALAAEEDSPQLLEQLDQDLLLVEAQVKEIFFKSCPLPSWGWLAAVLDHTVANMVVEMY